MKKDKYIPVYRQLIETIGNGFCILDTDTKSEVAGFIQQKQHDTGLFIGRDGNPDLYYTLFGAWLSEAAGMENLLDDLRYFFSHGNPYNYCRSEADRFAAMLVRQTTDSTNTPKPGIFYLARLLTKSDKNINMAYRLFFLLLLMDNHYGGKVLPRLIAGSVLRLFSFSSDPPSSFYAAIIAGRLSAGLSVKREVDALKACFERGKGFKVFPGLQEADLLSTGVSLFALKKAGADIQPFAGDCLGLIQDNYRNGAFIAGHGDEIPDLEYTFYGLLAAGSLV